MEHPNKLKLESFVLHLRKKTGLTQQELAQLAGVGKTVIFDLEHGKQSIQLDTLLKIFKALNVKLNLKHPLMEITL